MKVNLYSITKKSIQLFKSACIITAIFFSHNVSSCPLAEGKATFVDITTPKAFIKNGDAAHIFSSMEPNNTAINNEGILYFLDSHMGQVKITDLDGRIIRIFSKKGKQAGQLLIPKALALDSSNNVFIADTGNHRIQHFNSQGRLITSWGKFGYGDTEFISPSGIAVDAQFVYIADTGNNRISVYKKNGDFVRAFGSYGAGEINFNQPTGITTDGYGNLYIADSQNNRIKKYSRNGKFYSAWGAQGHLTGQLSTPFGIQIHKGLLYITELGNHRIQLFKENGEFHSLFTPSKNQESIKNPGDIRIHYPASFALSPNGNYSLACEPRIIRCQTFINNKPLTSVVMEDSPRWESGPVSAHFQGESAFDKNILAVLDSESHRINLFKAPQHSWLSELSSKFNQLKRSYSNDEGSNEIMSNNVKPSNWQHLFSFGGFGSSAGRFKSPAGIAIDARNNRLAISDRHNHRIQIFSLEKNTHGNITHAQFRLSIGSFGNKVGQFNEPTSLHFDAQGELHVLDSQNQRIQIFSLHGHFRHSINLYLPDSTKPYVSGFMLNPNGLGYAIIDSRYNVVRLFDASGNHLRTLGQRTIEGRKRKIQEDRFSTPYSVAINRNNDLFISDLSDQTIKKFSWEGKLLMQWGQWGNQPGEFYKPKSIAVNDESNRLYVTDYGNYRIQTFSDKGEYLDELLINKRQQNSQQESPL